MHLCEILPVKGLATFVIYGCQLFEMGQISEDRKTFLIILDVCNILISCFYKKN